MKIEIKKEEAVEILKMYLQSMFPKMEIKNNVTTYSSEFAFEVTNKKETQKVEE